MLLEHTLIKPLYILEFLWNLISIWFTLIPDIAIHNTPSQFLFRDKHLTDIELET